MINKTDVHNLAKSFRYAFHGIAYCIMNERNMRIHLSAVVIVSYFACFFGLGETECILLVLCFGFVLCAEAINTAIEALVNLESPSYHHYARIAKDVAAGGVAVSAITSAIVGFRLFWKPEKLTAAFSRIFSAPLPGVVAVLLLLGAVLFVFNGPRLFGAKQNNAEDLNNYRK